MASAALGGLLLGLTVRGILPGLLSCLALIPLMLVLSKGAGPWRAGVMTLLAELGLLLAAFEGAITAIPWTFPVALLLAAPGAMFPGMLHSLLHRWRDSRNLVEREYLLWSLPFSWTAAEFVASRRWIWGEFASPVTLGYTQFDTPLLAVAALGGVTGVTFAVLVINVSFALALRSRRPDPLLAILVLVSLISFSPKGAEQSQSQRLPITVGVIQPALDNDLYELSADVPETRTVILERLVDLIRGATGAQLIVLPEGALPRGIEPAEFLRSLTPGSGQTPDLLAGTLSIRNGETFNSVVHILDGAAGVVYDKLATVPVGESSIEAGDSLTVGNWGGAWVAPLICLDSLYPTLSSRLARLGAEALVVLSNDSFSKRMVTPWLHLRASAFRAVETGLPLVFVSAHGPSAVIGPRGEIIAMTEFGSTTSLVAELPAPIGTTSYVRIGEVTGTLAVSVTAALLIVVVYRLVRGRLALPRAYAPHER